MLTRNWMPFFRETGEILTGSGGMVHMEKNWGESFPESWIWTQGAAAHPEKVGGGGRGWWFGVIRCESF